MNDRGGGSWFAAVLVAIAARGTRVRDLRDADRPCHSSFGGVTAASPAAMPGSTRVSGDENGRVVGRPSWYRGGCLGRRFRVLCPARGRRRAQRWHLDRGFDGAELFTSGGVGGYGGGSDGPRQVVRVGRFAVLPSGRGLVLLPRRWRLLGSVVMRPMTRHRGSSRFRRPWRDPAGTFGQDISVAAWRAGLGRSRGHLFGANGWQGGQ